MGNSCELSAVDLQKLQQWVGAHGTPQQVALRCRIVLAAAMGGSDVAIAQQLSVNRNTVILWRKRFADQGLDGLWDVAPGRGRKPIYAIEKIAALVDATLQTKPAGMTHWSCRTMAQNQGVSKSTVNNIWRAHNLQPHRTESFKLSRDPKVSGEDDRCGGRVLESATTGNRALRRRKEPDSGAGSHSAGIANQEGPLRHDDPGLQAQRNHYPVRRSGNLTRQGHRGVPWETPPSGVHKIPAPARNRVSRRYPVTSDHGQLWNPQTRKSTGVDEK